jgi:hypothetical protein
MPLSLEHETRKRRFGNLVALLVIMEDWMLFTLTFAGDRTKTSAS